jgi:serine/threonine-protein kinase
MTSTPPPTLPVVPVIASRYRVVRELGRGGMGVVYVVEHTRTGDQMALKLLHGRAAQDPQAIERFRREARASARIKSEHVVKVVDADVAPEMDNAPFLVMELLDGTDLQRKVENEGRLSPDQVMYFLGQAARALAKSHAVGIVHRDLKPENLFAHRREDGSTMLKILDFGISKIVGGEAAGDISTSGMTNTGAVMGTPLYMAPEQARGRVHEIGPATDTWAMGLIALFLLTGEIYWRANTVAELMVQILSDPMYPPTQRWPWLPPGIDAWFAHSCAREPTGRFASIVQQMEALGVALGSGHSFVPESLPQGASHDMAVAVTGPKGSSTTGATTGDPIQGPPRSRAPLVATLITLLVVGGGAAAFLMRGGAKPPAGPEPAIAATNAAPAPSAAAQQAAVAPGSPPAAPVAPPPPAVETIAQLPAPAACAVAPASPAPAPHQAAAATHVGPKPAAAAPAAPAPQPAAAPAPAAKPAPNCNPPYVIDAAGHRQYKPECL